MRHESKLNRKKRILFVCTGNICRSPLAHRMFEKLASEQNRSLEFIVDSCGTGAWHEGDNADWRMRKTTKLHGWKFNKYARKIQARDIEESDYIYVMDVGHISEIKQMLPPDKQNLLKKVALLRSYDAEAQEFEKDVPDPYYGGANAFHEVYAMIERSCKRLLEIL